MAWQQMTTSSFGIPLAQSMQSTDGMSPDMIRYMAEQAAQHAARNPNDQVAVANAVHWQQRLMSAVSGGPSPAAPTAPAGPAQQPAGQQGTFRMPGAQQAAPAAQQAVPPVTPLFSNPVVQIPGSWQNNQCKFPYGGRPEASSTR